VASTLSIPAKVRAALAASFAKGIALPDARRAAEKKLGLRAGYALSYDRVYFVAIGAANPIPGLSPDSSKSEIRSAVRKRRDGKDGASVPNSGATKGLGLRRWETVAASVEAAIGRSFSVKDAKDLYGDRESYVGKGTRAAAPSTRAADGEGS
jgi:hypothetical protein